MAGLPSHLFVVRHGNRLDTADKRWHLSSPTPYDPPVTYGGLLQGRQVGYQIRSILEQAKIDAESSSRNTTQKRRRFRVVIHSSPFERCIQTSVGIASGLSQFLPDASFNPTDLMIPVEATLGVQKSDYRTSLLRLDSFLGEWQAADYFDHITPPPASSLMLGTAKANLLKREDYSSYIELSNRPQETPRKSSLWNSPDGSETLTVGSASQRSVSTSTAASNGQNDEGQGYNPPRATYAASTGGEIPPGFVAHPRDQCLTFDYQWDSMRPPYEFGDGGKLPEEWTAMHKRFRKGIKKLLNWYATAEDVTGMAAPLSNETERFPGEEIETVVIIVSHGAGCNALIGAITHQPVLMDVGLASITMAIRKENLDYHQLLRDSESKDDSGKPLVHVDYMYDIRLSASTDHLRSNSTTPVSARSSSMANGWNNTTTHRGRTSTLGSTASSTSLGPDFIGFHDSFSSAISRGTSANAACGVSPGRDHIYRDRVPIVPSAGLSTNRKNSKSTANSSDLPPSSSTAAPTIITGLWKPSAPSSSLRLMDDGLNDRDNQDDGFPNFDQTRISQGYIPEKTHNPMDTIDKDGPDGPLQSRKFHKGPLLAAPIKLQTNWGSNSNTDRDKTPTEVPMSKLEHSMGTLLGEPPSPEEADVHRDLSHTKRRWTVNERSRP